MGYPVCVPLRERGADKVVDEVETPQVSSMLGILSSSFK